METAMNNQGQGNTAAVLANESHVARCWEASDYDDEDCGCRDQWRRHSFEFLEIVRILAER